MRARWLAGRGAERPGPGPEDRSQVSLAQGPGEGEQGAKPETGVLGNRFLETDLSDQLRETGI